MSDQDPRLRAFCSPGGPAVFDGIVYGTQLWTWDPFDVPQIHADARKTFERLLDDASRAAAGSGRALLLLGEAGSGKTHLLRAFRHATHGSGRGYCGYLQLTSRTDDYAKYVLSHLVDSLELPYGGRPSGVAPDGWLAASTTGFARLADAVLDAAGPIRHAERRLLEEAAAPDALARAVYAVADEVARHPRFAAIDLDLIRVVLFLLSRDGRVRAVAAKWLRCEDLSRFDREWLGDLVPRTGPEAAFRQVIAIGRLMGAVDAALVLLVDQMEGVVEVAHESGIDPGVVLRNVANTLIALDDALPNAVVVLACLEDLFSVGRAHLSVPTLHRLEREPEPVRLGARRTIEQIEAIVARRLAVFFHERGVAPEHDQPIAPFTRADLQPLVEFGGRTRDMLHHLQQHRRRCIAAGQWAPLTEPDPVVLAGPVEATDTRTSLRWNDFLAGWRLGALSDARMADLLAWAAQMVPNEIDGAPKVDARADGRFVELDLDGERTLLAVVEESEEALGRSLAEGTARAGNRPAVFVRSTDFPEPAGEHRTLVVQNADWRALEALREFSDQNQAAEGFAAWLRSERPLSARPAIQDLLEIAVDSSGRAREGTEELWPSESGPFRLGLATDGAEVALDPRPLGHVGLLGGPRSGRTTAALVIAEALACRGVPVAIVERKGDLARYIDPAAWAEPMEDPHRAARRATFLARTRPRLWTPGAVDGRPLGMAALPPDLGQDPVGSLAAAALGGWMAYRSKAHEPKIEVLRRAMRLLADRDQPVTVPALRALLESGEAALGPSRHLKAVATDLATLWIRKRWLLEGDERLDVERMFRLRPERTNVEIVNTRHLGEDEDDWIAQMLVGLVSWCRRAVDHRGPAPRACLVLDDADVWLAPSAVPAARAALAALLAEAGRAGLVVLVVARGAPDLEPAVRDRIAGWVVGRMTERVPRGALPPVLEQHRAIVEPALPRLKPGQVWLARDEPALVDLDFNLIPARTQPERWVLGLARDGRTRREDTRWLG